MFESLVLCFAFIRHFLRHYLLFYLSNLSEDVSAMNLQWFLSYEKRL